MVKKVKQFQEAPVEQSQAPEVAPAENYPREHIHFFVNKNMNHGVKISIKLVENLNHS